jgi:hypothetical protein
MRLKLAARLTVRHTNYRCGSRQAWELRRRKYLRIIRVSSDDAFQGDYV